jgi:hypothetical protein
MTADHIWSSPTDFTPHLLNLWPPSSNNGTHHFPLYTPHNFHHLHSPTPTSQKESTSAATRPDGAPSCWKSPVPRSITPHIFCRSVQKVWPDILPTTWLQAGCCRFLFIPSTCHLEGTWQNIRKSWRPCSCSCTYLWWQRYSLETLRTYLAHVASYLCAWGIINLAILDFGWDLICKKCITTKNYEQSTWCCAVHKYIGMPRFIKINRNYASQSRLCMTQFIHLTISEPN